MTMSSHDRPNTVSSAGMMPWMINLATRMLDQCRNMPQPLGIDTVCFGFAHGWVPHLIRTGPRRVLDIGSGTGRDAVWFGSLGHRVVAVEPTDAMRIPAMALHPSPAIEWLNDSLPDLALLLARAEKFDLVMLSAVWMHLDEAQRQRAMPNLAALVRTEGAVIMKLRHGPVPAGSRSV